MFIAYTNNYQPSDNNKRLRIRFFESGVEESASVYQVASLKVEQVEDLLKSIVQDKTI